MRNKAGVRSWFLRVILLLTALAAVDCGRADSVGSYTSPDTGNLVALGEWGRSGSLLFRVMKVAEARALETQAKKEKAPGGTRFVIVTLQVMPVEKETGTVDYPASVRLLDAKGQGYQSQSDRFLEANGQPLPVETRIEAGTFIERIVPFLVGEKFEPLALRCTGTPDAEPVDLALRRK
jgi:hypothetical protein